jgi:hypothetical protein
MALQIPPNCDLTLGLTCLEKAIDATTVWRMRVDERFLNPAGDRPGRIPLGDDGFGDGRLGRTQRQGPQGLRRQHRDEVVVPSTGAKRRRPDVHRERLEARQRRGVPRRPGCHDDQGNLVATASSTYLIKERGE